MAFARAPDLRTAAHETAHVVQQRAGVHLKSGVGHEGDPYEQHADAVAARVVSGQSAEGLLDEFTGRSSEGHVPALQCSAGPTIVQRYTEPKQGIRVSNQGRLVHKGPKELYATPELVAEAAQALRAAGALVTLEAVEDEHYEFLYASNEEFVRVKPAINDDAVKGALWKRLKEKQGDEFRAYADCYRTSCTASGVNPVAQKPAVEVLTLGGGANVDVITKSKAQLGGFESTPANRAEMSFFGYALPDFLELVTTPNNKKLAEMCKAIIPSLKKFKEKDKDDSHRYKFARNVYKEILADGDVKELFSAYFGVNGSIEPSIGAAIVQFNNPEEKAAAQDDKWNFHWAGVILKDGTDYITLENCATELEEATIEEMMLNSDFAVDNEDVKSRGVKPKSGKNKQNLVNNRWYFKLYGKGEQSFHEENLKDSHATPSAISLPMVKKR